MTPQEAEPRLHVINRLIPTAAIAAATLAITGCGSSSQNEAGPSSQTQPLEVTQTAAKATPKEECSRHDISPDEALHQQSPASLRRDLGTLSMLASDTEKATAGDGWTVGGILVDSFRDPRYAEAITVANKRLQSGTPVTVTDLLAIKTADPKLCNGDKALKKDAKVQYQRTTDLGKTLLKDLVDKYGEQGADSAKRGLKWAQKKYESAKTRLNEAMQ